jgi:hypothetical protein
MGVHQRSMAVRQILAPGVAFLKMSTRLQQGAGRTEAVVHVAEQGILEIGITAETQFFDQSHDGGIADTGMFGQT